MERPRFIVPRWIGFIIITIGLFVFLVSYFRLSLYVTTLNCLDYCTPAMHSTIWEFSLVLVSRFPYFPAANLLILTLLYIPLIAALVIMVASMWLLINPQRFFMRWLYRSWLAGIVMLLIILPFLFIGLHPELGYVGMLVGYGFFLGGYRVFLAAQNQQAAASREAA